ncbi:MAG: hypothetical protein ACRCVX_16190 [Shewanella sp.]
MRNLIFIFSMLWALSGAAQTIDNTILINVQKPSTNEYWRTTWGALKADIGAGVGSVTSVGATVPAFMTVTGVPISTTGTMAFAFNSQAANLVFASPSGSAGVPSFIPLDPNHIPTLPASKITGSAITAGSTRLSFTGSITGLTGGTIDVNEANIAINNLSGTLAANKGGTGLSSVGAAGTVLNSNGTTNQYTALAFTSNAATAPTWTALSLNFPPASATTTLGGITNGTQVVAGLKIFSAQIAANAGVKAGNANGVGLVMDGGMTFRTNTQLSGLLTSSTTLSTTDQYVAVGQLTASITIGLPNCSQSIGDNGLTFTIHKGGTDNFAVILDPNGAQTFANGATVANIYGQGNSVTCTCLGGVSGPNTWAISYQ